MRGGLVLTVLALAGCNEHVGWNPNYLATSSPYGQYREAREAGLTGEGTAPATVPVALPVYAPVPVTEGGRVVLVPPAMLPPATTPAVAQTPAGSARP